MSFFLPGCVYPFDLKSPRPHSEIKSVTVTKGDTLVSTYLDAVQDSGNALQRKFCSRCGTPLYNIGGDFGKTLAVFYSALDDYDCCSDGDTIPKPKVEYYSKDRLPWVGPIEGAQQPRTKPGRDD